MTLPKGVQTVKKRRADGSIATYFYWRASGTRLPDDPTSREFLVAIETAKRPHIIESAGTFAALVREYKRSPGYRNLRPATQRYYDRHLASVRAWDSYQVGDIRRRDVTAIRDSIALHAPQSANQLVMVLSVLMDFAVEMEYREANPCHDIRRLPGEHHLRWSDFQIEYALTNFKEFYRRAVVLALHTGQREGDCVSLRWSQYDGATIRLTQQKTRVSLEIPVTSVLKAELDTWKRDATAVNILTNAGGRPWNPRSFPVQFSLLVRRHPCLSGLTFHGLRMTAAARLAEHGCTLHEIKAITGHKTLSMIELYTREADQQSLARSAVLKMERKPNPPVNRAENQ